MLYIPSDILDDLNAAMTSIETSDATVNGRMEVYVCKWKEEDKKLKNALEQKYEEDVERLKELEKSYQNMASSLESKGKGQHESSVGSDFNSLTTTTGPLGSMELYSTRKVLYNLIGTLNAALPDYDFSDVRAEDFERVSFSNVKSHVEMLLFSNDIGRSVLLKRLWKAIMFAVSSEAIKDIRRVHSSRMSSDSESSVGLFTGVDIFRFNAADDIIEAPDGTVWSFYYLFYNRKFNRMLFFTMAAQKSIVDEDMEGFDVLSQDNTPLASEGDPESSNVSKARNMLELPAVFKLPPVRYPPVDKTTVAESSSSSKRKR
jgi:hypothetical protein